MATGNPALIRQINREAVLSHLRSAKSCSRANLVQALNLAPASVSAIVNELMEDNLIIETGQLQEKSGNAGRPSKEIALNRDAAYVIGISLNLIGNGLSIEAVWSDYIGNNSEITQKQIDDDLSYALILREVTIIFNLIKEQLPQVRSLLSVAIGIPGVVSDTEVLHSPRLQCILGADFHKDLEQIMDVPLFLENDVNLGLLSEINSNELEETGNYGYLLISEGVGAAVSLSPCEWQSKGWSGEIGHIKIPIEGGGFRRLESVIGLHGILISDMTALGLVFEGEMLNFTQPEHTEQLERLMYQYTNYLLIAIQALNAALGLDEVILNCQQTGFLKYIYPQLVAEIDQSPLKLAVSISNISNLSLVHGATMLALTNSRRALT